MNYTLSQLRIFLRVVQTRSVTKAAEELNLSQPAVSMQLKNLQDQFDIPLTEVVGRKLFVTEFGNEIARVAENILQQVAAIDYKTQSFKGLLTGRLTLSVVLTGKYMMPYFLAPFLKRHTGVEVHMDVTNRSGAIASLESNSVDFALVSILPTVPVVEKLDLLENELYMVCGPEGSVRKAPYPKSALGEWPLIFREEGSGTRMVMEAFIARHRLQVSREMVLASNEAVKQAVLAGLGYSIMPYVGMRQELKTGQLRIVPVSGLPLRNTWRLIWLKGKKHSPLAAAFLQYMREEKDKVVKQHFSMD